MKQSIFVRSMAFFLCFAMIFPWICVDISASAASDTSAVGQSIDSFTANSQTFALSTDSRIYVVTESEPKGELLQTVQLIQRQFAADSRPSATPMTIAWGSEEWITDGDIVIQFDDVVGAEGYKLDVTSMALLTVSDYRGLIYGANMLLKHLRYASSNTIQGFTAADSPDTVQRAVSLDCGRKYYSKNWICNFIREMSWMGYNTLELHFSDDSGFRLDIWDEAYYTGDFQPANDFSWICGSNYTSWTLSAYKNDPDKGKYLTTAEVVEILETAKEYHIDVIPAFDSPSHMDYLTWTYEQNYKSNPGYSFYSTYDQKTYYAKDVGGCINYTNSTGWSTALKWPYYSTIDITAAQDKAFIFELYIDIANFFKTYSDSTDFSIGADEVNLNASNISSSYSFAWGFPDFVVYINELNALLNSMGYTMRMYNDFMGSTSYNASSYDFDSNIEILYWDSPFNPSASSNTNHTEPVSYYVEKGMTLYNCIQTNTYYALRITGSGSDARSVYNRQWTFYHSNEEDIFNEWYPADISEHGDYSEDVEDVPAANLGGAYFLIWCDYACVSTEQEIWNGVYDKTTQNTGEFYSLRDRMWSNVAKMWNWDLNDSVTFAEFEVLRDAYGDFPGCGTSTGACSEQTILPEPTAPVDGHIHSYVSQSIDATCTEYEKVRYTCSLCGDSYVTYPEHLMSQWEETKPEGIDESLLETKTVYRYADKETINSVEPELDGYTQTGSEWIQASDGAVRYVSTWPSGFSTGSDLYSQYNNKAQKVAAFETDTAKRTIDGDAVCGYLYYHWCYANSYYSTANKTGSYTTFHAYYSTSAPSNYVCDTSDMSYKTAHSTCPTNSDWFFVAYVYEQSYTDYEKQYTYERWSDWSDWTDEPITATDSRTVETGTMYRYVDGTYASHTWNERGTCTLCGATCSHRYQNNICADCGFAKPAYDYYLFGWINGANYACEEDAANLGEYKFADGRMVVFFTEDSYVGVKASDNASYYMTNGWQGYVSSVTLYNTASLESADKLFVPGGTEVTFTLTDNGDDTYLLSYVAVECEHPSHSADGVCTVCGDVVEHSYDTDGFCVCGLECEHTMSDGNCTICGKACNHVYRNNTCTLCGQSKPVMEYYLFGYINGADYACEGDYANLGEYKFVDGKLVVKFKSDSYVAVKSSDNAHWYMTAGWQGQVSSATLYNTKILTNADKLYVPGGKQVTFTLTDNGDDTYVLSYEAVCTHESHNQDGLCIVCEEPVLHSYQANVCTICGYEKPLLDYYLFGYINGADYADKADGENLGVYKFEDGTLVAYFTADSYVAVKTSDNQNRYMTDGYQEGKTTVTLVHADSILSEDKLFVPGNMKITFTLVDNGDDTYQLSYEAVVCPHDSHNAIGICDLCAQTVSHRYVEGVCACGAVCAHSYQNGICTICELACAHSWSDGVCSICESRCVHSWTEGACQICGSVCAHNWIEGACSICGIGCTHEWSDGKCVICGVACTHTYQNNICTNCGFVKPATDYYLFGHINGEDYAWGENAGQLGEYKFVDGMLVVTFQQDSSIGLKAGNNSGWYMTDGEQGSSTTVVLYNTAAISSGTLLTVPGGKEITFTLVDNGDDTLTLHYVAVDCPHESHSTDGICFKCGSAVAHSYESVTIVPTCTEGGYTTHTCTCGASYTDAETAATGHSWVDGHCGTCGGTCQHSYEDGVCAVCGMAEPKPALNLSYPSLSFEDQIQYNVYFTLENLELSDVTQMGLITFPQRLEDGTIADAREIFTGYSVNNGVYMAHTAGIPAKNLGDVVYMKAYAELADGTYIYSQIAGYNAVTYANTVLSGEDESAKALVVAMLNYGAAAQEYFGYNTDNLMNAGLTAEQLALAASYDESMIDDVAQADSTKVGIFTHNGGYSSLYPTVSFEGAFSINYYLTTRYTPDSAPVFYYWDAVTYSSVEELTPENATGILDMVQDGEKWSATISGIAAKEIDQTYYTAAIYTVGETVYTSPVISYSLGSYCESIAANGTAFGAATAVYGYYAKAYFA